MGMVKALSGAVAASLLLCSAAQAEWATFSDARGTAVQYPREMFPVAAGQGTPPGPMLQSADGRTRLHVFTLPNERRASPAEFVRRAVTDKSERLAYKRVTNRFLVFSAAEGGLIPTGAATSRAVRSIASTCAIRARKSGRGMARSRG
jgi:hypothetical protein